VRPVVGVLSLKAVGTHDHAVFGVEIHELPGLEEDGGDDVDSRSGIGKYLLI
jgi:hypothetical protein